LHLRAGAGAGPGGEQGLPLEGEGAEQAVRLVLDAGREEERPRAAGGGAVAERQPPQVVDDDGVALGVGELAAAGAGLGVARADVAVAEVADQEVVAERAGAGGGREQPPGGGGGG